MKCPGQDMQYWNADAIFEEACPECGHMVEFYKDDTTRKCKKCGNRFVNPKMDFGCAAYCKFAEQCLGTLPEEFVGQQDNLLKDKVAVEMKRYYRTDFKRISHATRVARHAEKIGMAEGGSLAIILCAAYLQNIGSEEAWKSSSKPSDSDIRLASQQVAQDILQRLSAKETLASEVCTLIGPQQQDGASSIEYKILADADRIVCLEDEHKQSPFDPVRMTTILKDDFLLPASRMEAEKTFKQLGLL